MSPVFSKEVKYLFRKLQTIPPNPVLKTLDQKSPFRFNMLIGLFVCLDIDLIGNAIILLSIKWQLLFLSQVSFLLKSDYSS